MDDQKQRNFLANMMCAAMKCGSLHSKLPDGDGSIAFGKLIRENVEFLKTATVWPAEQVRAALATIPDDEFKPYNNYGLGVAAYNSLSTVARDLGYKKWADFVEAIEEGWTAAPTNPFAEPKAAPAP